VGGLVGCVIVVWPVQVVWLVVDGGLQCPDGLSAYPGGECVGV